MHFPLEQEMAMQYNINTSNLLSCLIEFESLEISFYFPFNAVIYRTITAMTLAYFKGYIASNSRLTF
jgi:hypothetical protein